MNLKTFLLFSNNFYRALQSLSFFRSHQRKESVSLFLVKFTFCSWRTRVSGSGRAWSELPLRVTSTALSGHFFQRLGNDIVGNVPEMCLKIRWENVTHYIFVTSLPYFLESHLIKLLYDHYGHPMCIELCAFNVRRSAWRAMKVHLQIGGDLR